jgi:hypothetical protein
MAAAGALRRAAGKVHLCALPTDTDRHGNALPLAGHTIVVEEILRAIDSVGDCRNRGGHHFGRVVEKVASIRDDFAAPVLFNKPNQPAFADAAGGDLRR